MKRFHSNVRRSFGVCFRSAMAVLPSLLLFSASLRGQVLDTAFFINEAHQWWDSSVYRYAAFIGSMPVEPVWSGAEVAEAPDGTHLIVLPITGGPEVRLSDGWHATAQQPNGGVRLVLKRFSPVQIFPLLFFVYGYDDYVAAVGPAAVYSKNKPHSLDTTFTGEAFYMYPGLFPGDTLRLVNGIGVQNGGIAKEFYPDRTGSGGVGYRCCVTTGSYNGGFSSTGDAAILPEIIITYDCSGCWGYWVSILNGGSGSGSNPNNMNWSPENFVGNNGGPGGDPNGDTKVNPKLNAALCPDGSLRPPDGCKCDDGSPMPADGDCGEVNCTLTNVDVWRDGATVYFEAPFFYMYNFGYLTRVIGRLTDCTNGNSTFRSMLATHVEPYSAEIIAQDHIVIDFREEEVVKAWLQNVWQYVQVKASYSYTLFGVDLYWESTRFGTDEIAFWFKYK